MQIAPVSVVFALATAGALGMAVKDTVTASPPPAVREFDEAADDYVRSTEAELEEQRLTLEDYAEAGREEQRRIFAARATVIPTLFGDLVASRGPAFGVLDLGMSVERYDVSRSEPSDQLAAASLLLEARADTRVTAFVVRGVVRESETCELARETLVERWGVPTVLADEFQHIWWNAKTGDRVRVDTTDSCDLVFEKAQSIDTWWPRVQALAAAKTRAQVVRATTETGVDDVTLNDTSGWWTEPGLAAGDGPTSVFFTFDGDTVTSVVVSVSTHPDTVAAVEAKLRKTHGQPSDETIDTVVWAARKVRLARTSDTTLELTHGAL